VRAYRGEKEDVAIETTTAAAFVSLSGRCSVRVGCCVFVIDVEI